MGVELGTSIGAGISSVGTGVAIGVSSGPAITLGSAFPEGAAATFTTVANLDSGPIGGWGKGLAAPEPLSFGSRSGFSTSFTEGLAMNKPTDQLNLNTQSELNVSDVLFQAESILAQAARPRIIGQPEVSGLFVPEVPKPEIIEVAPVILPQAEPKIASAPWIEYIIAPTTQVAVGPAVGIFPASITQTENKTEAGPITQLSQTITISVPQEQAVQVTEETVAEDEQEEEKVQQVKAVHVIDRKAAACRITKILARALLVIAGLTSPQKIKGADLIIGLPTSNKQEIRGGEINIKDPEERLADKTWDATKEKLQELEFDSLQQIETQVPEVVLNNHPVILATEDTGGERASTKNVVKSHDNKAPHPHLVCEIRRKLIKEQRSRISKSSQQPTQILVEEKQVTEEEKPIQVHPELAEALKAGKIWG